MTIKPKSQLSKRGIEIDLTGPEGNAFFLLGTAQNLANQLDRDPRPILEKMEASDYENLIKVFEEEFGDFATLYR